jgi:hypothetical protein
MTGRKAGATAADLLTLPIDEIRAEHLAAVAALAGSLAGRVWTATRSGQAVSQALSRLPEACEEISRLHRLLVAARLGHQNLTAAARASLAAAEDGERDPWYYLRDELQAQSQLAGNGRWLP